ncbi:MAG: ergothioneine biosynthesis protein EgtB [Burkholderiales bacterium]|nr:ergothioneine biosynthesis protein EgtB [Burkholderiales bacterium]
MPDERIPPPAAARQGLTLPPPRPAASVLSIEARQAGSHFLGIRGATEALAAGLSPEDCALQSMPDASPVKWHLGHTAWFFETFLLQAHVPDYRPFREGFDYLFNADYDHLGPRLPAERRGLQSRPTLEEVVLYRRHVNDGVVRLLSDQWPLPSTATAVLEFGLQREQQYQERLLADLKHLFSLNPARPAYRSVPLPVTSAVKPLQWYAYPEGLRRIGHGGDGFAFDNEGGAHRQFLEPFEIASRLITNGEFLAFMEDGGYERPELWMADGWKTVLANDWFAPLYWSREGRKWMAFTLSGLREVDLDEPVCHVSWYEADAFARWSGVRLPTEGEWEIAALDAAQGGNFVESGRFHPAPLMATLRADWGPAQLFGDTWEWTGSAHLPYPGYRPTDTVPGDLGRKFMANLFVLRGGSCATPQSHIRATYRHFLPSDARWQFSGIRLARTPKA